MKKSKLINYTTQDFVSEKELELKLFRCALKFYYPK